MAGRGSLRRGSCTRTGWRTESGTNTETSTLQDFTLSSKFPLIADFCLGAFLFQDAEASESWHDGKAQRRTDERCHIFWTDSTPCLFQAHFQFQPLSPVSVTTKSYGANVGSARTPRCGRKFQAECQQRVHSHFYLCSFHCISVKISHM